MPVFTGGNKRGQDTKHGFLSPLDSPYLPLRRDALRLRGETGVTGARLRGLGSGRRFAHGTLLAPEFTLRKAPRITVRGQTVQSVRFVLQKAPLRSRIVPWSTRRPCGPLAFRRATEGSRVLRKGWGVKRGRETLVSLPLLPLAVGTASPGRRRRPLHTLTLSVKPPPPAAPLYRQKDIPSAEGKEERASALDKGF